MVRPTGTSTAVVAIRRRRRADAAEDVAAVWADGHAVLVLAPTTSDAAAARLLASVRPTMLLHERPDGRRRTTRLASPRLLPPGMAAVVATSGTTGTASLVVVGNDAMDSSTRTGLRRLDAADHHVWALALPLDHVAGLLVVRRSMAGGTRPEVHEEFDAPGLLAGAADWWALVPTQLHRLVVAARADGSDLAGRRILLGGAAAPEDLLTQARALGAHIVTSYGMTETCGGCVYDGRPLDGVEVEVQGDTVRLRGAVIAAGRLPPAPDGPVEVAGGHAGPVAALDPIVDEDGWLTTADRGVLTSGVLTVLGRSDDIVISGGVNVDTRAVVSVLRDAGADDAHVVGVDDPEWGARVEAFVVAERVDTATWNALVRARIGPAAVPKRYHHVSVIPRGGLGKPDLSALWSTVRGRF